MPQSAKQRKPPRCGVFFRIRHLDWNCFSASSYPAKRTRPLIEKILMNYYIFIASK